MTRTVHAPHITMLSPQEMDKRRAAFNKALASLQANGITFTADDHALAERYIRGELSIQQIIQQLAAEDSPSSPAPAPSTSTSAVAPATDGPDSAGAPRAATSHMRIS